MGIHEAFGKHNIPSAGAKHSVGEFCAVQELTPRTARQNWTLERLAAKTLPAALKRPAGVFAVVAGSNKCEASFCRFKRQLRRANMMGDSCSCSYALFVVS